MSEDVEKAVAEVLRLVAGFEETVVALTETGLVRLDRWVCRSWSLRRDQLAAGRDVIIALWLRHVSEGDVDKAETEYATGTDAYRIIKEESERFGIDEGPELKRADLYFYPAELHVKKTYGNRIVYSLEPCRDEIKVSAVRVYQPAWRVCEYGEPEHCWRRTALTESIKARNVPIDDVVGGVYIPLDVSSLTRLLRRIL